MENIEQKLKQVRNVSMTDGEKSVMRQYLKGYMAQYRPLLRPSPYTSHIHIFSRLAALSLVAVILGGGGISAAASKALPGETLYKVKIHVNEEVKGFFAVTPKQKLVFQEARLEERFKEIRFLAQTPSENTEAPKELAQAIQEQTDDIKQTIDEIQEPKESPTKEDVAVSEVAEETSQKVTDSLEVHEALLSQGEETDSNGEELASVLLPALSDAKDTLEEVVSGVNTVEIEEKPVESTENTTDESSATNQPSEKKPGEVIQEKTPEISSTELEVVDEMGPLPLSEAKPLLNEVTTETLSGTPSGQPSESQKIEQVTEPTLSKVVGFIKLGCEAKACKIAPDMTKISVSIIDANTKTTISSILPDVTGYITSSLPVGNYILQTQKNGQVIFEKSISVDGISAVTVTLEETPITSIIQSVGSTR
jgi:hypothetical protein